MARQKLIYLSKLVGSFAENKDLARDIRKEKIIPALSKEQEVVLDFKGVETTTQSFIHALISELIRDFGPEILDKIVFKNCSETVQKIIELVVDYMQQID